MLEFGKALSRARELVLTDLGREGMPLERACAVAVRLLDLGYFRIGNDVYVDKNGSFGLTTLRASHVRKRRQDRLVFSFVGKSGRRARDRDRRRGRDRGGRDHASPARGGAGCWPTRTAVVAIGAARLVNAYVREATGLEATAKDFRTWHATVLGAPRSPRPRSQGRPRPRASARWPAR